MDRSNALRETSVLKLERIRDQAGIVAGENSSDATASRQNLCAASLAVGAD
jgi:hypothetical protein